jgi:hypothetical protein
VRSAEPDGNRQALAAFSPHTQGNKAMNSIVYIVGAVVIVLFILGFLGLR